MFDWFAEVEFVEYMKTYTAHAHRQAQHIYAGHLITVQFNCQNQ